MTFLSRLIALLLIINTPVAYGDWTVLAGSTVGFVSIKNNATGEVNTFDQLSGTLSDNGRRRITAPICLCDCAQ